MAKVTFLGAGSTVFAKNILGDCLSSPVLQESEFALYDIDPVRLNESRILVETLNTNLAGGKATVTTHLGVAQRPKALAGADYVVNAIQVGGYRPSTLVDFEVPKRFGLRQTIGDTLGIGGIFRALRTIPILNQVAQEMAVVCPDAWFLNYSNPMAMLVGALLRRGVKTVGLCHSVQCCAENLLRDLGMREGVSDLRWTIAGINHMAWLLDIRDGRRDLYPEVKARALAANSAARMPGAPKHHDMVRYEILRHFGHYVTESSEHNAEYTPYWIKSRYPGLVEEFGIPLDEYPRRCERQIAEWEERRDQLIGNRGLTHSRSQEYGSFILEAMETDVPFRIAGNVANQGLITNLPREAIVEVPCLVDKNGVQPTVVGSLPPVLAALNTTNVQVQTLTIEASESLRLDDVYHAAFVDPHTSSELTLDEIRSLCDAMIEAHGNSLPRYR